MDAERRLEQYRISNSRMALESVVMVAEVVQVADAQLLALTGSEDGLLEMKRGIAKAVPRLQSLIGILEGSDNDA